MAARYSMGHRYGSDPILLCLWCRLAAVALTPGLGTSICCRCSHREEGRKGRREGRKRKKEIDNSPFHPNPSGCSPGPLSLLLPTNHSVSITFTISPPPSPSFILSKPPSPHPKLKNKNKMHLICIRILEYSWNM